MRARRARASRDRARDLGLPEEATLTYRPRSRAADADALRAELRRAPRRGPGRAGSRHTARTATRSLLAHAGRPLRAYGSQGQQRLGLLALLFAERDVLLDARGTPPLMLLDDVMSELDSARRERLVELLAAGGQAVITTTDLDHVPGATGERRRRAGGHVGPARAGAGGVRRLAPRPLSEALDPLRRELAPATTLARVQEVWPPVAGAAAREATPVSERAGHRHVRVPVVGLGGRAGADGERT